MILSIESIGFIDFKRRPDRPTSKSWRNSDCDVCSTEPPHHVRGEDGSGAGRGRWRRMKFMRRNDVLCWAGLAALLTAGCGASTGETLSPASVAEAGPVPSKSTASKAGEGPRASRTARAIPGPEIRQVASRATEDSRGRFMAARRRASGRAARPADGLHSPETLCNEQTHATHVARSSLHADRAPGGDRDHRRAHRPAAAGRAVGPRGGPPRPVHEQPEADRPGGPQLPQRA